MLHIAVSSPSSCRFVKAGIVLCLTSLPCRAEAAQPLEDTALRGQAREALHRGVEFFRREVAVEGTYLWEYSADLTKREGEGVATATQGWAQPPGTPAVGLALLSAYEATGDAFYLGAARETAYGLIRGQLRSGGWHYAIEFAPKARRKIAYRDGGEKSGRNVTTFDDDTTTASLRFLLRADKALKFQDAKIHEALIYALTSVLKAQYPNGAWPQGYDEFPDPQNFPIKAASFPETWPRVWPGSQKYWFRYTLNDNVLANLIATMLEAGHIGSETEAGTALNAVAKQCRAAALKAGDFLILAQMPEPQPAWAQQYDFEMHPAWARKFEPPAVTCGESQGALKALLRLYRESGERKYLEPVPRALAYLRRSRLAGGELARFYELRTNKPLYFTTDYQLTYNDADAPTHYSFKVADNSETISRDYERLAKLSPEELKTEQAAMPQREAVQLAEVRSVIEAQDARGRWIEGGGLRFHRPKDPTVSVIRSATFKRNVELLSRYLAAPKK